MAHPTLLNSLPGPTSQKLRSGVIVAAIDGRSHSKCKFIVMLDDAKGPDSLLVFVPTEAFIPREAPRSKSEATRQNERERGFHLCDRVFVDVPAGSNIAQTIDLTRHQHPDFRAARDAVLASSPVVFSPPDDSGNVRCYSPRFGELEVPPARHDHFKRYHYNVAYNAEIAIKIEPHLRNDREPPRATLTTELRDIVGVNGNAVFVDSATGGAQTTQTSICCMAPWNQDFVVPRANAVRLVDVDGSVSEVTTGNDYKHKEILRPMRAFFLDEECRTAYCRRFPDDLLLIGDPFFNHGRQGDQRFMIGDWIKATFFFSPVKNAWIVVNVEPEADSYSREVRAARALKPIEAQLYVPEEDVAYYRYKLVVQRSPLFRGHFVAPLLSVRSEAVWCFVADPQEVLANTTSAEVHVWARFAGAERAAKFTIDELAEEPDVDHLPVLLKGEGFYIGGARSLICVKDKPYTRVVMPSWFANEINPGDRVNFIAMWNATLSKYVALDLEKHARDGPLVSIFTEHGPTFLMQIVRVGERAFHHEDVGLVEDSDRIVPLKNLKAGIDMEAVYIALNQDPNSTTLFAVVSRERPQVVQVDESATPDEETRFRVGYPLLAWTRSVLDVCRNSTDPDLLSLHSRVVENLDRRNLDVHLTLMD